MKICPKCHKEFSNEQGFCGNCGVKLEMKPRFCTKCGTQLNENDQFCPQCGAKTSDDVLSQVRDNITRAGEVVKNTSREVLSDETVEKVKNTVGNAFSEENREKVKGVANEAVEAIKKLDIENGKEVANEGINKIRNSKYGKIAVIAIIIVAIGMFYMRNYSDEGQVRKIAETHAEIGLKYEKSGEAISDSDIKKLVNQVIPEKREDSANDLKRMQNKTEKILEKLEEEDDYKREYEERLEAYKDAEYEISKIDIKGDEGVVTVRYKNHPERRAMHVHVVKIDGKWYRDSINVERSKRK